MKCNIQTYWMTRATSILSLWLAGVTTSLMHGKFWAPCFCYPAEWTLKSPVGFCIDTKRDTEKWLVWLGNRFNPWPKRNGLQPDKILCHHKNPCQQINTKMILPHELQTQPFLWTKIHKAKPTKQWMSSSTHYQTALPVCHVAHTKCNVNKVTLLSCAAVSCNFEENQTFGIFPQAWSLAVMSKN